MNRFFIALATVLVVTSSAHAKCPATKVEIPGLPTSCQLNDDCLGISCTASLTAPSPASGELSTTSTLKFNPCVTPINVGVTSSIKSTISTVLKKFEFDVTLPEQKLEAQGEIPVPNTSGMVKIIYTVGGNSESLTVGLSLGFGNGLDAILSPLPLLENQAIPVKVADCTPSSGGGGNSTSTSSADFAFASVVATAVPAILAF